MIYTKIIGDRQVFSDCRTIQAGDGSWISNPSAEQIAAAGWEPYTPPVVPQAQPDTQDIVEAVKRMLEKDAEGLSDEEALEVAALYPAWAGKVGETVAAGERLWYDGRLWKVVQTHTAAAEWTPDATPALYTEVSVEEWPEWVRPTGAQDAYNTGDKVTYNGHKYTSLIDGNVYSPEEYPAGWRQED